MSDWNTTIIEEFRANAGKVGGPFDGTPLLLLHHTGAKSGTKRVNPLAYQRLDGGGLAVFASKGGAPSDPDWFYNVTAHPNAEVEVGTERLAVTARVASGDERTAIWSRQKLERPAFARYEAKTEREIPVVILEPR